MSRRRFILAAAGALGGGGAFLALSQFFGHSERLKRAIGDGSPFKVHATGYWPSTARSDERKMEGKNEDRIGAPLHTLEEYLDGKSDHVSISGDLDIFPYGQKLVVEGWPGVPGLVGRVVDTGSHFFNVGGLVKKGKGSKVYRVIGEEPLDFDVYSSKTFVPKKGITARPVVGDHWASRTKKTVKEIHTEKLVGLDLLGAA